jgi:putative glutamine amidotransferase
MPPIIGLTLGRLDDQNGQPTRLALSLAYIAALQRAGAAPLLLPTGIPLARLPALLQRIDGLLLSGGGDIYPARYRQAPHAGLRSVDPSRDALELKLARLAIERQIPVLGICRGLQVLNVTSGGSLYQDLPSQRPSSLEHQPPTPDPTCLHGVRLEPESRLARIVGAKSLEVNSDHHQSIQALGRGWVVAATSLDGVIEAIEYPDHPFALGVQWHPERLPPGDRSRRLMAAFIRAARGE